MEILHKKEIEHHKQKLAHYVTNHLRLQEQHQFEINRSTSLHISNVQLKEVSAIMQEELYTANTRLKKLDGEFQELNDRYKK